MGKPASKAGPLGLSYAVADWRETSASRSTRSDEGGAATRAPINPVIAAWAKAAGAEIHWGDESGLRSDDARGRGFAPKGKTPVIRVNSKRHGLSVISAVVHKGEVRWRIFDRALNTDILIDLKVNGLQTPRVKQSVVRRSGSRRGP